MMRIGWVSGSIPLGGGNEMQFSSSFHFYCPREKCLPKRFSRLLPLRKFGNADPRPLLDPGAGVAFFPRKFAPAMGRKGGRALSTPQGGPVCGGVCFSAHLRRRRRWEVRKWPLSREDWLGRRPTPWGTLQHKAPSLRLAKEACPGMHPPQDPLESWGINFLPGAPKVWLRALPPSPQGECRARRPAWQPPAVGAPGCLVLAEQRYDYFY